MKKINLFLGIAALCMLGTTDVKSGGSPAVNALSKNFGNMVFELGSMVWQGNKETVLIKLKDKDGKVTVFRATDKLIIKPGLTTNTTKGTYAMTGLPYDIEVHHVNGVHPKIGECFAVSTIAGSGTNTEADNATMSVTYEAPLGLFGVQTVSGYKCACVGGGDCTNARGLVSGLRVKAKKLVNDAVNNTADTLDDKAREELNDALEG